MIMKIQSMLKHSWQCLSQWCPALRHCLCLQLHQANCQQVRCWDERVPSTQKRVDIECSYLPKPHLWHPVAGLVTDLKKQARWEQCGYKMVQELSELRERFQKPFPSQAERTSLAPPERWAWAPSWLRGKRWDAVNAELTLGGRMWKLEDVFCNFLPQAMGKSWPCAVCFPLFALKEDQKSWSRNLIYFTLFLPGPSCCHLAITICRWKWNLNEFYCQWNHCNFLFVKPDIVQRSEVPLIIPLAQRLQVAPVTKLQNRNRKSWPDLWFIEFYWLVWSILYNFRLVR